MNTSIRRWLLPALLLGSALDFGGCASLAPTASAVRPDPALQKAMDEVYPALVRIWVIVSECGEGRENKMLAAGSGAIISPEGYVVTNHHVVGHAKRIWCTLPNRERVDAELVGSDPMTDIAVIRLLPSTMRNPVKEFPCARWGDSDKVVAGQRVFALGSPGAIAQSITSGVVANPNIVMVGNQMMQDGESVGSLVRWIFHDAQIYHGNSGGPLVNANAEIVGINELGTAALGGAIPANTARYVAEQLIKNNGKVPRSWIGLETQKLLFEDNEEAGALVTGTEPDSPAAKAGIQAGDKLMAINGKKITLRYDEEAPELNATILNAAPGEKMQLLLKRNGKELPVEVVGELRGLVKAPEQECSSWGITASNLTRFIAQPYKLKPNEGVLVTSIRSGGPADQAKPRLGPGAVIRAIGGEPVGSLEELLEKTKRIIADKTEPVPTLVTFRAGLDEVVTVVKIGPEHDPENPKTARRAWFPGNVQILTKDVAEAMKLEGAPHGVRVTRLYPVQFEAAKSFLVGDILTKINGQVIDAYDPSHIDIFPTMVRQCSTSDETEFAVLRDGKPLSIKVQLPREPKPTAEMDTWKDEFLGFKVRGLSESDRINLDLPSAKDDPRKGAVVSAVEPGGWASLGGLQNSDKVISINGQPCDSIADVQAAIEAAAKARPASVVFFVKRQSDTLFVELRPAWNGRH